MNEILITPIESPVHYTVKVGRDPYGERENSYVVHICRDGWCVDYGESLTSSEVDYLVIELKRQIKLRILMDHAQLID